MTAADWVAAAILLGVVAALLFVAAAVPRRSQGVEPIPARALRQMQEREVTHPTHDGTG